MVEDAKNAAQKELITEAATVFHGQLNEFLDKARRQLDQIIDHVNIDTILHSDWETGTAEKAQALIADFTAYLETHKDEIKALSIFYDQPYNRREITFQMIKQVMDKLRMDKPALAPAAVWEAYATVETVKGAAPKDELTALVSLIRRACGIDNELKAFDKTIDENFKNWMFQQNAGQHNRFNAEQMEWLRMIKDHVVHSYHIELDDLDYTPFDAKGGRGKMYQLFGDDMTPLIHELNEILAA